MQKNVVAKKLTVILEKTETGFSSYVKEIDGLATVGDSVSEIKNNFLEALEYHVEYLHEKGNASIKIDDFEIEYVLDIEQFFEYFSVINKTAFAENYVKINPSLFRQYTKGLTSLSSDKLKQISKGLNKLANELNDLSIS